MNNKRIRSSVFTVVTLFILTACSVTSQQGVMKAEKRKGGFAGLSTLAAVESSTPAAFKGVNNVVIGGFKVGFNESKRVSNKAGGGLFGSAYGGKSTALAKLDGISASIKQEITNKAYSDFVAQLQASGYNVVSRSQFINSAHYKGTKEYDFPYVDDNSGLLSEYGVGTYYSPKEIGTKQPIFTGEIQGVTGGIGFSNPMNATAKFGKETGIAVLNVTYFVDFAGADGHGNFWSSTSSVKVGQILSVDTGLLGISSGYGGTFSKKVGSLRLGQPISSDKEFAIIEDSSSNTEKTVEAVTNTATALLGLGTNITRKFTYKANPDKYTAASIDVLSKANQAFIGEMAAKK